MSVIRLDHVSYVYSKGTPFEKTAVDDVSLEIEKMEIVGAISHTGSGKSTLMQHLNALLEPTSGKVYIDGEDVWADPKNVRRFRFKVGLVFQYPEYQLFEETIYKDVAFGPTNMGLSEAEVDARVRHALSMVGIAEQDFEKSPFELSGGQKRRVAIAGVMAMSPEVLVLDEPTAGLDPMGREQILSEITRYHRETGCTILLVSHSMEDIANYAGKALVMNDGRLFLYDDVEKVFSHQRELAAMGLSVPQVAKIFSRLAERGYPVDPNVFRVPDAVRQIRTLLEKGGRSDA